MRRIKAETINKIKIGDMVFYEGIFLKVLGKELNGEIAGKTYYVVLRLEGNIVKPFKSKKETILKMV